MLLFNDTAFHVPILIRKRSIGPLRVLLMATLDTDIATQAQDADARATRLTSCRAPIDLCLLHSVSTMLMEL